MNRVACLGVLLTFFVATVGGQVRLDDVVMTRQKAPVITGKVALDRFDLGPVGKILTANDDPSSGLEPAIPLGGEISGDVVLEKISLRGREAA